MFHNKLRTQLPPGDGKTSAWIRTTNRVTSLQMCESPMLEIVLQRLVLICFAYLTGFAIVETSDNCWNLFDAACANGGTRMWHVWISEHHEESVLFSFWKCLGCLRCAIYIHFGQASRFQIRCTVNFPRHDAQSFGGWECIGWNHGRHRWYHLHSVGLLPEECPAAKTASDPEPTDFVPRVRG